MVLIQDRFQWVIAGVLGLLLGLAALFSPLGTLIGLGAVLGVMITFWKPGIGILTVITLISTVFPESVIPRINLGFGHLYLFDLILVFLFFIILVRAFLTKTHPLVSTPLDGFVFLFIFWALISTVIAVLNKTVESPYAISELRILAYYSMYFTMTNLIRSKSALVNFMEGFFFLATIVAIAYILQYTLGTSFAFLSGRVENLVTGTQSYSDIVRITDTTGEGLITSAFLIKTITLFISKLRFRRIFDYFQWILYGIGFSLTFNRTHWMGVLISLIITFFLVNSYDRKKIVNWVIIIVCFTPLLLLPVLLNPDTSVNHLINAVMERFLTIGEEESYVSEEISTIKWRDFEYDYALPVIMENPIFGTGLGAIYRPYVESMDHTNFDGRRYTHNGHLWIALKTGLVGYFFFLLMMGMYIWRGFKYIKHIEDNEIRGIYLNFTLLGITAFLTAMFHPIFMVLSWTPILGAAMGVNEVIYNIIIRDQAIQSKKVKQDTPVLVKKTA